MTNLKIHLQKLIEAERNLIKKLESTDPPDGFNEYGTELSYFYHKDISDAQWRLKHWQDHLEQVNEENRENQKSGSR